MSESPIEQLRTPEALRRRQLGIRAQRVGWLLMLLLIVAALMGLLGPGPLSTSRAVSADGALDVRYSRYLRLGTTTRLEVQLALEDPGRQPRVLLDTDYLATFTILGIRPEPQEVIARGDQIEYVFAPPERAGEITLAFDLSTEEFGWHSGMVRLPGGGSVAIGHLIYP